MASEHERRHTCEGYAECATCGLFFWTADRARPEGAVRVKIGAFADQQWAYIELDGDRYSIDPGLAGRFVSYGDEREFKVIPATEGSDTKGENDA